MMVLKNINEITAKEIMTTDFFVCKEDFNLFLAIDKVLRRKVHSIVVVDENSKIRDIISPTDLLKVIFLDYNEYHTMKVADIMKKNKEIIYIHEDTNLPNIIRTMKDKGISTLIVVNNELKPIGIVHIKDVLRIIEKFIC